MVFLIPDEYHRDSSSSMHQDQKGGDENRSNNKVKARLASQGLSRAVTPAKRCCLSLGAEAEQLSLLHFVKVDQREMKALICSAVQPKALIDRWARRCEDAPKKYQALAWNRSG
jgi:hypothetical protein